MPLNPADIVQLIGYTIPPIQAAITAAGLNPADYTIGSKRKETRDMGSVVGKYIDLFPLSYGTDSPATRREDYYDVTIVAVYFERLPVDVEYTDGWVDNNIAFVEQCIFNPLQNNELTLGISGEYWPQLAEVTSVYDFVRLSRDNMFWSECEFTFRKLKV